MEEGQLKQDFFISDDGYINIRLKVITEDKGDRERIVAELMGLVYKKEGFNLSQCVEVDTMYFHNQDPKNLLKSLKLDSINKIEAVFEDSINQ